MNDEMLDLIARQPPLLFSRDLDQHAERVATLCRGSAFLVIGGAGSVGQAVVKEILRRNPAACHVVDLSENNLVELVRDVRSSSIDVRGDFRTLPLDYASIAFRRFAASVPPYDYVLNLSALKHVRSEKDPYSLMRLLEVNVLDTEALLRWAAARRVRGYFSVSTDKAANPASLMGASKRMMELVLLRESRDVRVSSARFANVAFSDGSLPHGFRQRLLKRQPIVAPHDVRRYFLVPQEAGELCLMACLLGENRDIFFPKPGTELPAVGFPDIATRFLAREGFEAVPCVSEEEAKRSVDELADRGKWPCYFPASDTSGEKPCEEFFVAGEALDLERFFAIGVVTHAVPGDEEVIERFKADITSIRRSRSWYKEDIVAALRHAVPTLSHLEKHKSLDEKM